MIFLMLNLGIKILNFEYIEKTLEYTDLLVKVFAFLMWFSIILFVYLKISIVNYIVILWLVFFRSDMIY